MPYTPKPKRNRRPVNTLQAILQQAAIQRISIADGSTTLTVELKVVSIDEGNVIEEGRPMEGTPSLVVCLGPLVDTTVSQVMNTARDVVTITLSGPVATDDIVTVLDPEGSLRTKFGARIAPATYRVP